jgi:hypothetical protein
MPIRLWANAQIARVHPGVSRRIDGDDLKPDIALL